MTKSRVKPEGATAYKEALPPRNDKKAIDKNALRPDS